MRRLEANILDDMRTTRELRNLRESELIRRGFDVVSRTRTLELEIELLEGICHEFLHLSFRFCLQEDTYTGHENQDTLS